MASDSIRGHRGHFVFGTKIQNVNKKLTYCELTAAVCKQTAEICKQTAEICKQTDKICKQTADFFFVNKQINM